MSEAAGILVGQSVGAGDDAGLRVIGNVSILLSLGLVLLFGIGFTFFPNFFASFYMNIHLLKNHPILRLTHVLFMIMALTLILSSLRDVMSGLLRGLFDTQFPMQVGLLVMWCLVLPIGYLLAFPLHLGVIGFKMGGNIGLAIGAVIIYRRWSLKTREYKNQVVLAR
jgi:MATE family multidrug resistance protein